MSAVVPRVSVLMPVHNGMPYLRESLQSVLGQTLEEIEVVVVDDASDDGSHGYVRALGDERVRVVRNDVNRGQMPSLNRGLSLTRASYVARLDQDDVCHPDRLRRQADFLDRTPGVDVVGTWGYRIDSTGRRLSAWRERADDRGRFLGQLLLGKCPLWHPSVMFRKDPVVAVGGYDESYSSSADYDLWVQLAMRGGRAATIPAHLVEYRTHEGQSTQRCHTALRAANRCAHLRFVRAHCDGRVADLVAMLLALDVAIWDRCRSAAELGGVVNAVHATLEAVALRHGLTDAERTSLRRVVFARIGLGPVIGRRLQRAPAALAYTAFLALSPLLIPGVHPIVSRGAEMLRRLSYTRGANALPRRERSRR